MHYCKTRHNKTHISGFLAGFTLTKWVRWVKVDGKLVADLKTQPDVIIETQPNLSKRDFKCTVQQSINNHLPRRRDLSTETKGRKHLVTVEEKGLELIVKSK